ncbi:MAG TPA: transposase [Candidatus Sulfomarinibacteraceae bacterium]|nr:transposase [Candidatus Sulfomarinibacteraceae bacterium]
MERILILEADQQFAVGLERDLQAQFAQETTAVATVREACLFLAQQPYDLAFIPHNDLENVIRALHSLQPDLPLVVLREDGEAPASGSYPDVVKGALLKTELEQGLPSLMQTVRQSISPPPSNGTVTPAAEDEANLAVEPATEQFSGAEQVAGDTPAAEETAQSEQRSADILPLLKQIVREEKVLGAMISREGRVLAHNGNLDAGQVEAICRRVTGTWRPSNSALIQFIRLASRSGDLLLFTRPLRGDYLLTVAALPDHPVGQLRRQTDEPVRQLSALVHGELRASSQASVVATTRALGSDSGDGASYALVWRPRQPMPGMLQIALRRALERIAQANDCRLQHLIVDAELVHVVVRCPEEMTAARIAHLFKRDAEKEIQQQFGVPAQLWQKGYYATEGDEPLSQVELNLFLSNRARN